jgi:diguanylate cyclase (GGDEF)-like protein/PAS domain S-box-containing protein
MDLHALLRRQLRRRSIDAGSLPADWVALVKEVDEAYKAFDADRRMLERSLDLSSRELLAANRDMRAASELLRATLESTADGILAVDSNGKVTFANERFLQLWRIPRTLAERADDDALLEYVLDQLADPEAFLAKVRDLYNSSEESMDRLDFKDGRVFERYSRPLVDLDGVAGRVWSFRDVTERVHAEEALRRSEERFRALAQNSSDMIVIIDEQTAAVYVSPSVERIMGYTPQDLIGVPVATLLHPDDLARGSQSLAGVLAEPGVHPPSEVHLRHKNGGWRRIELIANNLLHDPAVRGVVFNARDVTERRHAEESLRQSEQRFRSLVQNGSDVITVIDGERRIVYQSPSFEHVLGYPVEAALGKDFTLGLHPDDAEPVLSFIRDGLRASGTVVPIEARVRHADGSWRTMEFVGSDLRHDPAIQGYVLNVRDITERKNLEDQLRHQAFHDPLTGLANRARFTDRLEHALLRQRRKPSQLAVVFLDVDNFKSVNDGLGHAAGDKALVELARRIEQAVRVGDTVARFGGDEFAILLEDLASVDEAAEITGRLIESLREPIRLDDHPIITQVSGGIALSGLDETSVDGLLRNADVAMYVAKQGGKGRVEVYDEQMHLALHERMQLMSDLQHALEGGEFVLHYQPIVSLSTTDVLGVEALARWEHPRRGSIPPAQFIPLAEESGVIRELGRWVLAEACRQAHQWHQQFAKNPPLRMSVNVSGVQIDDRFVSDVQAILQDTGVDASALILELTESVTMREIPSIERLLHQLKSLGIRLAIDDFGTGYSSLSYLHRFPFDILKIDKSFIADASGGPRNQLTTAIAEIARTLGLELMAEGIERLQQVDSLREIGCDTGQGFLFARPMRAEDVERILCESYQRRQAA